MNKFHLLVISLVLSVSSAFSQQFAIDTVYFDFDSHRLKSQSLQTIDSLVKVIDSYKHFYINVYGHTDSIGTSNYNVDLSARRAQAVALYLIADGVNAERISYEGLGTSKPVSTNDSFKGRLKNRRADIAIVYTDYVDLPVAEAPTAPVDTTPKLSEAEVLAMETDTIYAEYDPFLIDVRKQNVIYSPDGVKVIIPPNSFQTDEQQITFELKELFNRRDILLLGMPSADKKGPLETAGMFQISSTFNGRGVKLNKDTRITVRVPASRRDEEMALYLGSGGGRGGRRNAKLPTTQGFNPVRSWALRQDVPVNFNGQDKAYEVEVSEMGRMNVARPLFYSQNTSEEDKGVDITLKLKGPVYERNTTVLLAGEVVKTYIPMKKQDKRTYIGSAVKFLDDKTKLVMVAIQYDKEGTPYLAKRSFRPGDFIKKQKGKKKKKRPTIKLKIKYRRMTKDHLIELLDAI